ncbi:MAG: hypothetical protein ABFD90_12750, partial [Phycisphaerales bacterium]
GDRLGRNVASEAIKAFATVEGVWFPTTNEIIIDIKDKSEWGADDVYRVRPGEGSLIVERGTIYPQGSWHSAGGLPMVLKKAR